MKPLILTMSLLVTAASLNAAAGQQTPDPPTETAPSPKTMKAHDQVATPLADSPLVRAAKVSTKRSKKKPAPVITNDNLQKSGGHITTTKTQRPLPVIAPPEMTVAEAAAIEKHNREVREAAKAKVKKAEADRKLQQERNAAIYNGDDSEGMLEDPALAEGKMNPEPKPAPPPAKPPAS